MFPSTGLFNDLMCPDTSCKRPHCSFWHDLEQTTTPSHGSQTHINQPLVYPDLFSSQPNSTHMDTYNPYNQQTSSFAGYSASVVEPSTISYSVEPSCSYTGYLSSPVDPYVPDGCGDNIPSYDPSPVSQPQAMCSSKIEPISKSLSVAVKIKEEPIEDNDCVIIEPQPKIKVEPVDPDYCPIVKKMAKKELPLPSVSHKKNLPDPEKSGNLLDCAKSISEIDAEIERLKQLREQHKQKAAELRGPIKKNTKKEGQRKEEKPFIEYVPKLKEEKPSVSVGYTPTPLAELEKRKEEKRKAEEARKEKERQKAEKRLRRKSSSELSQEDLFGEDPLSVPVKRPRVEEQKKDSSREKLQEVLAARRETASTSTDSVKERTNPMPTGVTKGVALTEEQIAEARKRVARPGAATISRPSTTNRKVASAIEQMKARMEAVNKERQAAACASTNGSTKKLTLEQQFGESRSTAKEGRTAKVPQAAIKNGAKPSLHDPFNAKVPSSIRNSYLLKFHSEYMNFLPYDEARVQAELEEKSVLDKVKHKQAYAVACVNALKKIRDIADGKTISATTSKVSHDQVLLGKHYGHVSINVNGPKQKTEVTEEKLYKALANDYLLDKEQLQKNSYPVWETPTRVHIEPSSYDKKRCKKTFVSDFDMSRTCVRCSTEFTLNQKGKIVEDTCIYHLKNKARMPGRIRNNEARYPCCGGDDSIQGCQMGAAHVFDTLRESELLRFVETPKPNGPHDPRSHKIFALDCEMIYTVWGPALARVTVVDFSENVVLDEIVKPSCAVIDYNTTFSGITAEQLDTATHTLSTVIQRFFELVNSESILIGHSLESDLKAMRIVHNRVVDTSVLFPHRIDDQKKRGLRELCLDKLGKSIQDDIDGHDSKEDSIAALQLAIYKAKFDGKLK